jgi:hypothetical protein
MVVFLGKMSVSYLTLLSWAQRGLNAKRHKRMAIYC